MEHTEHNIEPRRPGRPKTARKVVVQVPIDAPVLERIRAYSLEKGMSVADTVRRLITHEISLSDIPNHK